MRLTVRVLAALCGLLAGQGAAAAQMGKRVALVIGNAKYEHIAGLPNVPSDAKAMAALFERAKFDSVVTLHDQRVANLRRELLAFAERAGEADVAVLFYAGHGIEVDRVNYLIPVDARLKSDLAVEDEAVSLDRVLKLMEPARKLRVVILDACRENPFGRTMRITVPTRSVTRGLGRVEAGAGNTLIAFATEPNAVAEDGAGLNSPFTAALVKHLATPGLDLRIALGNVRDEVMASTGSKQRPYVTSSLGGGVIAIVPKGSDPAGLTPGPPPSVVPPPQGLSALAKAWAAAEASGSIAVLEWFRSEYGSQSPAYASRAETLIAEFKKQRGLVALTVEEERTLSPKDSFTECAECPEMVVAPAGSFMMGSPVSETKRSFDEGPQHRVTIKQPFAVGKFEATFAEWDACVDQGGCTHRPDADLWGRGKRPVINVSWEDVTRQYLPWLSRKTGKTYRLLTEAEWEYVARAGKSTPFWWGTSISPSQANYDGNHVYAGGPTGLYRSQTEPVDSFTANPWGLFNVHGNVFEWVQDCWNDNYYTAPTDGAAWTIGDCSRRVVRGGSWWYGPWRLRAAYRDAGATPDRNDNLGFRVARTLLVGEKLGLTAPPAPKPETPIDWSEPSPPGGFGFSAPGKTPSADEDEAVFKRWEERARGKK